jgi:hypothetical protein
MRHLTETIQFGSIGISKRKNGENNIQTGILRPGILQNWGP